MESIIIIFKFILVGIVLLLTLYVHLVLDVVFIEGLGPGAVTAAGRRRRALEQERIWARERRADALSTRQGFNIVRRGFSRLQ